jgi:hypothetical protein
MEKVGHKSEMNGNKEISIAFAYWMEKRIDLIAQNESKLSTGL